MLTSTRANKNVTSSMAIIEGISNDGGLYVLNEIPKVNLEDLKNLSYKELAVEILSKFLTDFTKDELQYCVKEAYDKNFNTEEVVNVSKVNDHYYLELYHGPTLAFKDVALTILPQLLKVSKEKNNVSSKTTILTATSGDTGSAALSGFSQIEGIDIIVFYPDGGVSKIQEQQMLSFESSSAKTFAIKGNFDDCQSFVKKVFNEDFKGLSSANSINIGRLVPQIVYYFYTYFKLLNEGEIKEGEKINFCVPTGNFGDILAGYYALQMGLPINKLICASNINNVLTDFFNTLTYDRNREFLKTTSPSMDILISSNLERLLYHVTNDASLVKKYMEELKTTGKYTLDSAYKDKLSMFSAGYASDEKGLQAIRQEFKDTGYLMDPHTAVAKAVYDDYKKKTNDDTKTVILSTASPYKFINSMALALELDMKDEFMLVDDIYNASKMPIPNQIEEIRKNIKTNHKSTLEEAYAYLEENLK